MRRVILWSVGAGLIAALLVLTTAARLDLVVAPGPPPETRAFWLVSRALGVTAYVTLAASVLFGLALSTGAADRALPRARSLDAHRALSGTALVLTAGHALALLGDGHVRFDLVDIAVPFAASHRSVAVALGIAGGYAALAVHASFALRKRLGQRLWRALHYLSFAAFAAATLHGVLAGSDTRAGWARLVYAGAMALVLWLTVFRIGRLGVASAAAGSKPIGPGMGRVAPATRAAAGRRA